MTVHEALPVLCAARTVGLRTRDGAEIPVDVLEIDGDRLIATAPRFRVSIGLELSARIVDPGGEPWMLRFRVIRADVAGPDTARIELRPEDVAPDDQRRLDQRFPAGGDVELVAVNCQEVVDGDSLRGRIVDVSASGVAITTDRVLRRGDRLMFRGRFFTETVEAEVRVMSIRGADTGRRIYGCRFLEMADESRDRLERVLADDRPAPASIDLGALRDLMAEAAPEAGGWRRRLRRTA
jgi:hypothetical protein